MTEGENRGYIDASIPRKSRENGSQCVIAQFEVRSQSQRPEGRRTGAYVSPVLGASRPCGRQPAPPKRHKSAARFTAYAGFVLLARVVYSVSISSAYRLAKVPKKAAGTHPRPLGLSPRFAQLV